DPLPPPPSTRSQTSARTYAQAIQASVKKSQKPTQTFTPKPVSPKTFFKAERQLMVLRDNTPPETSYEPVDIRDAINNVLLKEGALKDVEVEAAKANTHTNIIFHTMETAKAEEVMKYSDKINSAIKKIDTGITQIRTGDHWKKVLIQGVDLQRFSD